MIDNCAYYCICIVSYYAWRCSLFCSFLSVIFNRVADCSWNCWNITAIAHDKHTITVHTVIECDSMIVTLTVLFWILFALRHSQKCPWVFKTNTLQIYHGNIILIILLYVFTFVIKTSATITVKNKFIPKTSKFDPILNRNLGLILRLFLLCSGLDQFVTAFPGKKYLPLLISFNSGGDYAFLTFPFVHVCVYLRLRF